MNIRLLGKTINIGGSGKPDSMPMKRSTSYMVNPYYRHQGSWKPGQVIYVDDPSKFIIPDGGDNSEEHW